MIDTLTPTPQSVTPTQEALAFARAALDDARDLLMETLDPKTEAHTYRRIISQALLCLNEAQEQLEGRAVCRFCAGLGRTEYLGDNRIEIAACAACQGTGRSR